MSNNGARIRVGSKLGKDLTVLGKVTRSCDSIYIVWNHRAWCPMACKVYHSERRARRELEALSALRHPNIVRSFEFIEPNCMLMEFLEGPTLHAFIRMQRRARLSTSDAIRIAIYLGSALQCVHAASFIHMDIKPSNVIIVAGRPVLVDFGSMRRMDEPRPSNVVGTDGYIAPEECTCAIVGQPVDIFGLGVTFYESLTGKRPFPDGTRRNPHPQIKCDPIPLREVLPSAPVELEKLVMKCLARDPQSRPKLSTLLPALHSFIRHGPSMWPKGFDPKPPIRAHRNPAFEVDGAREADGRVQQRQLGEGALARWRA